MKSDGEWERRDVEMTTAIRKGEVILAVSHGRRQGMSGAICDQTRQLGPVHA